MRKILSAIIILTLVLTMTTFLVGCKDDTPEPTPDDGEKLFSVNDELHVPEKARTGLYYVSADGREIYKSDYGTAPEAAQCFDLSRNTVIFFHGMQFNSGYRSDEMQYCSYHHAEGYEEIDSAVLSHWAERGWNVLCFYWSAFADDSIDYDSMKIWSPDLMTVDYTGAKSKMRWAYEDESGQKQYEIEDVPTVSVAEIFAHEYAAIMKGFSGEEIRFVGHSMGGQLVVAAAGVVSAVESRGEIASALLPARVTALDPYYEFLDVDHSAYAKTHWDGKPFVNSSAKVVEIFAELASKGVAIEYVDGEIGNRFLHSNPTVFANLKKNTAFVDYVPADYLNQASMMSDWHNSVRQLYMLSIAFDMVYDTEGNPALFPTTPTVAIASYRDRIWDMETTHTFMPYDDGYFPITERTGGTVYGYAFRDDDNNGLMSGDYKQRYSGVAVTLYNNAGEVVATTTTNSYGMYRFDGLGAGNYHVSFATPTGATVITAGADDGAQHRNSGISADGSSAVFALTGTGYAYINAGYRS